MTYQVGLTSRAATMPIQSFAIARQVQQAATGGPTASHRTLPTTNPSSGQIKMSVVNNAAAQASTFKQGSKFAKITIVLDGVTPSGAKAPMRKWIVSDATIDSYSVAGTGGSAVATVNLHWTTMTLTAS
jgi:hypothetical protein